MNIDAVLQTRGLLANSGWLSRIRDFATSLRAAGHSPGGLLLVGTPEHEPWHFAAHLDDAARFSAQPHLAPTLVRHHIPPGAAPHLAVNLNRIQTAARGETVLLVAPTPTSDDLLNRIADARRAGAVILTIAGGNQDLADIAHDTLILNQADTLTPAPAPEASLDLIVDATEHLVSLSTRDATLPSIGGRARLRRRRQHVDANSLLQPPLRIAPE